MKCLLQKFQNTSLIRQFTLVVFFILFIPTVLIFVLYLDTFKTSLIDQGKALLQKDLDHLSYTMDSGLETIESVIAELVYQQEFSYFLNDETTLSKPEQQYFMAGLRSSSTKLRNLYSNYFKYLAVYSANSQVDESSDYIYDFIHLEQFKERTYAASILDNPDEFFYGKIRKPEYTYIYELDNIKVKEIDAWVIPVYQKIFSLNTGRLIGVIEINITLDKLVPSHNLPDTQAGIFYFLYDDKSGDFFPLDSATKAPNITAAFLTNTGMIQGTLDGQDYYFAYDRCEKTGMLKVTALSQATILKPVSGMITKVILGMLLALLIIVTLAYFAIKVLLHRLSEMGRMMKRIEEGDFDIHVNENGATEISQIATSFNRMGAHLQDTMLSLVAQEKMQKETELRALEAQINPHFLYNTLESMRMQCEIDEYYQVSDGLAALGDLFRYSIKWTDGEVPFALEWKNLKNYLAIMQLRHETNLTCTLDYQDDTGDMDNISVPKLILQPLIENCFNHGFKNEFPPFSIYVSAHLDATRLLITIQDNGVGISKERLNEIRTAFTLGTPIERTSSHHSIGLFNVKQRIDMLCKTESKIEIKSTINVGTTIAIHILI